jgi:multidrug efflux pump subunit AcrA (membrane-fusion protein)
MTTLKTLWVEYPWTFIKWLLHNAHEHPGSACAIVISICGLIIAARATKAANRQAEAAEAQAEAARHQTEVARAQTAAAIDSANAAREQADLLRGQIQASLRPVLMVLRVADGMYGKTFLQNQGAGIATFITFDYGSKSPPLSRSEMFDAKTELQKAFSADVLSANAQIEITPNYDLLTKEGMTIKYRSLDGRFFFTVISVSNNGVFHHTVMEGTQSAD